jgi:hypothetical protein
VHMQKQDEMSAPRFRRYSVSVFGWVSGTKEAVCDLNGLGRCSSAGLFMLTSALCGLAAALVFGYLRAAAPTTGPGSEFRVIGAVVVGGTPLTGGRGAFPLSPERRRDIATGLLIIVTGSLDLGLRRRPRSRIV